MGVIARGGHRSWSGIGTVEAGPGDVITVNPGELHDGAPLGGAPRAWRMLYLDPALVAAEGFSRIELARPVARAPRLAATFDHAFRRIAGEPADHMAGEEALVLLIASLFGELGTAPRTRRVTSPSVRRALDRLDSAPGRPVTLAELAALCGVSRFRLLRGFTREVGLTPHAYLLQRRVRRAQRMIADGASLAQAAVEAGFADQSHLTRAFARQVGITPGRYRAALR